MSSNEQLQKPVEEMNEREIEAFLVDVLDRSIVNERLKVTLPPGIHGEWVPRDPSEINRLKTLGFKIDNQYSNASKMHDIGESGNVVGDVIFMTCPQIVKDKIDAIRHERFVATHGRPDALDNQVEEIDYAEKMRSLEKDGIGRMQESKTETLSGTELKNVKEK